MVSYIKKESRANCLQHGYQTIRRHFNNLATSIDDTTSIVVGDNWYGHPRPVGDFERQEISNGILAQLHRQLHLSEDDRWTNTYLVGRREPYDLEFAIASKKIKEVVFRWFPFRRSLEWSSVVIAQRYQGRGIATGVRTTLEDISRELGVDVFFAVNIIDAHREYWKKQNDYQFQGNTALKRLS